MGRFYLGAPDSLSPGQQSQPTPNIPHVPRKPHSKTQALKCFAFKGLEIEGSIQKLLQRHQVSVPVPRGWCSCWVSANIPGGGEISSGEGLGWLRGYPRTAWGLCLSSPGCRNEEPEAVGGLSRGGVRQKSEG